ILEAKRYFDPGGPTLGQAVGLHEHHGGVIVMIKSQWSHALE
ncbi:unnamed protein product, partial [Brassica oleracea]